MAEASMGVRTVLMQETLKSPPLWGLYPAAHPSVHCVALAMAEGQLPGVSGRVGVGWEHTTAVGMMHFPTGAEKLPCVQVMERDPLATYPLAHPSTQELPDDVEAPQPPVVVLSVVRIGVGHGDGMQVPAGVENVPRVQVSESEPVAE